jgi:hypothetical protein
MHEPTYMSGHTIYNGWSSDETAQSLLFTFQGLPVRYIGRQMLMYQSSPIEYVMRAAYAITANMYRTTSVVSQPRNAKVWHLSFARFASSY